MSLFDFFKGEDKEQVKKYSQLHYILEKEYPQLSESELVITTCVAGLLARVAYVDFHLDEGEILQMKESLKNWKFTGEVCSEFVSKIAIEHVKEMAGLENHLYVHPLRDHLSKDDRFRVLQSLFLIAASDGNVESIESEEIRTVNKGLELSTQHFLAARAEVAGFLKALK